MLAAFILLVLLMRVSARKSGTHLWMMVRHQFVAKYLTFSFTVRAVLLFSAH